MTSKGRFLRWATQSCLLSLALILAAPFQATSAEKPTYQERFRPQFHFTPERNWMNDPNGMVFYDGEYHLFYQYNPFGDKWGHMSWGHAVSRDLVHWEHLPVALLEENGVMIFSGSAVVDWNNTSGFGVDGKPPMVAIYTGHYTAKPLQNQQIAYSNDRGRTWTKYAGNPVLDIWAKDFRDPKVMWHEPSKRWVMTVAMPTERKVRFYSSHNLREWTPLSEFGPAGAPNGIWECPDLFPLPVENESGQSKWVLIVNIGSGSVAGGSGAQYFVGEFDGTKFVAESQGGSEPALWVDYGKDFYAAVSWSDVPETDGRRLWLGWMSNWEYANDVPTSPWRSAMSIPRELVLRRTPAGLRLAQKPVVEMQKLRAVQREFKGGTIAEANEWLKTIAATSAGTEWVIEFESPKGAAHGIKLFKGAGKETVITIDPQKQQLAFDRTKSGNTTFQGKFPGVHTAPLKAQERSRLHLFVDTSSIEVFAEDGVRVITNLVLPEQDSDGVEFFGGPDTQVRAVTQWKLNSAWRVR